MHWIYVLYCECPEDEEEYVYYVGETTHLNRRLNEHFSHKGGANTQLWRPLELVAIYKLNTIALFWEYDSEVGHYLNGRPDKKWYLENMRKVRHRFEHGDKYPNLQCGNLHMENMITERLMFENRNNDKCLVRGGKYTRITCDNSYKMPEQIELSDLPVCYCKMPCDVKYNTKNKYFFFRCPKKNIWDDLKEEFFLDPDDEPCKFFQKYTKDESIISEMEADKKRWIENKIKERKERKEAKKLASIQNMKWRGL